MITSWKIHFSVSIEPGSATQVILTYSFDIAYQLQSSFKLFEDKFTHHGNLSDYPGVRKEGIRRGSSKTRKLRCFIIKHYTTLWDLGQEIWVGEISFTVYQVCGLGPNHWHSNLRQKHFSLVVVYYRFPANSYYSSQCIPQHLLCSVASVPPRYSGLTSTIHKLVLNVYKKFVTDFQHLTLRVTI